ncbi:MAG: translocation/assembly module TamB domain-containing protein [Myxococcota bacterium]
MKKVIRWCVRVLGSVLLLCVLSVALAHTSWGFELAKALVLPSLSRSVFAGTLQVGRLEGFLGTDFSLTELVLTDETGAPACEIERLRIRWDFLALLSGRVHVQAVDIESTRVTLRAGEGGGIAALLSPSPTKSSRSPDEPPRSPLPITVDRIYLSDGRFIFGRPEIRVEGVTLSGRFRFVEAELEATDVDLTAALRTQTPGPLTLEGRYGLVEGEHQLSATVSVAAARLRTEDLRWDGVHVPLGRLRAELPAGFMRAWLGGPEFGLRLQAESGPEPGREGGTLWRLEAQAEDADLRGQGRARGDGTEFELALRNVDPRSLSADAPGGRVSSRLEGRLLLGPLRGRLRTTSTATLSLPGGQARVPLQAEGEGELGEDGRLEARLRLRSPGSSADLAATLADLIERPRLQRLEASVQTPALEKLPLPGRPRGALEAETTWVAGEWSGRLTGRGLGVGLASVEVLDLEAGGRDFDLEGKLRAQDLRVGRFVQTETALRILPAERGKRFELDSTGRSPLQMVELSGTGQVGWPLDLALEEGTVVTGTSTWTLSPWQLAVGVDGLKVQDLAARTPEGELQVDGEARWRPDVEGQLRARADLADLSDLSFAFPQLRGGRLRVGVEAVWNEGGLKGETSGNAKLLVSPAREAIDVRFKGDIGAKIVVGGSVDGGNLGQLALDAEAEPPPSLAEWMALEEWLERLRRVDAAVDDVRLGGWTELFGLPAVEGGAEGSLVLRPDSLEGRFHADGLQISSMRAPLSIDLEAQGQDDQTSIQGRLLADVPVGVLSATVARSWRDASEWEASDGEARLELDRITMARFARFVDLPEPFDAPVGGELEAVAHLKQRGGQVGGELLLRARAVEPYPASPRIDLGLESVVGDQGWTVSATVAGRGLGQVRAELAGSGPPWRTLVPAEGRLQLQALRVTGLRALYPVPILRQGSLSGEVEWAEKGQRGQASLHLNEARIFDGQPDFALELSSERSAEGIDYLLSGLKGRLQLAGRIERAGEELAAWPLKGQLEALGLPLRSLVPTRAADGVDGTLDLIATVGGRLGAPSAVFTFDGANTRCGEVRFDGARFEGRYERGGLSITGTVTESSGGRLDLQFAAGEELMSSQVEADDFRLGFLSVPAGILAGPVGSFDGRLTGQVTAEGPTQSPDVDGELRVEDLQVVLPGTLPSVENGVAALAFHDGSFELSTRGGSPSGGRFGLSAEGQVEGPRISGSFESDGLRYLAGPIVTEITTSAEFELVRREAKLRIHRTKIRLPEENSSTLHGLGVPPDLVRVQTFGVRPKPEPPPTPPPPGTEPRLRLQVRNDDDISFRGEDAQGSATVDIQLEEFGNGISRLKGEGTVERGQIEVLGRTYQVERAVVGFTERIPPDPRLDIQLAHAFRTLTLYVYITGPASKPEVRFGSAPSGYDQAQLTAFFTGLQDPDSPGRATAGGSAASSVGQALLGPAIAQVRRQLPIDTLDIGSNGGAAVVTVGKWISETVFISAGYDGSRTGAAAYEGTLRWRFTPRWVLEVLASLESQSTDVLWTKRF